MTALQPFQKPTSRGTPGSCWSRAWALDSAGASWKARSPEPPAAHGGGSSRSGLSRVSPLTTSDQNVSEEFSASQN